MYGIQGKPHADITKSSQELCKELCIGAVKVRTSLTKQTSQQLHCGDPLGSIIVSELRLQMRQHRQQRLWTALVHLHCAKAKAVQIFASKHVEWSITELASTTLRRQCLHDDVESLVLELAVCRIANNDCRQKPL